MATSLDPNAYEFLAPLSDDEKRLFVSLEDAPAWLVYEAGKRGGVEAARAQLYPLSRGEVPPPLPPTEEELRLPESDPRSPRFASWCAAQSPQPRECNPEAMPESDPRSPKFADWCARQVPRPGNCPAPSPPAPLPTVLDATNTAGRGSASSDATRAGATESRLTSFLRNPPWYALVIGGGIFGAIAARVFGRGRGRAEPDEAD